MIRGYFTRAFALDPEIGRVLPAGSGIADALEAIGVAARGWVLRRARGDSQRIARSARCRHRPVDSLDERALVGDDGRWRTWWSARSFGWPSASTRWRHPTRSASTSLRSSSAPHASAYRPPSAEPKQRDRRPAMCSRTRSTLERSRRRDR
jgi:hypothetical protein